MFVSLVSLFYLSEFNKFPSEIKVCLGEESFYLQRSKHRGTAIFNKKVDDIVQVFLKMTRILFLKSGCEILTHKLVIPGIRSTK